MTVNRKWFPFLFWQWPHTVHYHSRKGLVLVGAEQHEASDWLPNQLACVARPKELFHIFPYSRPVEMTQDLVIALLIPKWPANGVEWTNFITSSQHFLGQQFGMLSPILE